MTFRRTTTFATAAILLAIAAMPTDALISQTTPATCAHTGACEIWIRSVPEGSVTDTAISPGGMKLYASVARATGTGNVRAFDAATGAVLWNRSVALAPESLQLSPDGTRLYVSGPPTLAAPQSSVLVALATSTGSVLWVRTHTGSGTAFRDFPITLTPDGARIFSTEQVSALDHRIAARDTSGTLLWTTSFGSSYGPSDLAASPDGATLLATGGNLVRAYSIASGAPMWNHLPGTGDAYVEFGSGSAVAYVAGWGADVVVRSYGTTTGTILDTATLDPLAGGSDSLQEFFVSPQTGRFSLSGTTRSSTDDTDYRALAALGSVNGGNVDIDWFATRDLPELSRTPGVALMPEGRGLLLATTGGPEGRELAEVVALSGGAVQGAARVRSLTPASGESILLSPLGDRAFVVVRPPGFGIGRNAIHAWNSDVPAQAGLFDSRQSDGGRGGDAGDSETFPSLLAVRGTTIGPFGGALFEGEDALDAYRLPIAGDDTMLVFEAEPQSAAIDLVLIHVGPDGSRIRIDATGAGGTEQILMANADAGLHTLLVAGSTLPIAGTSVFGTGGPIYVVKGSCYPFCLPTGSQE